MIYLLILLVAAPVVMTILGSAKDSNDEIMPGVVIEKKDKNFEIIVEIDYLGKEQYSYFTNKIEYDLFEEGDEIMCIFDDSLESNLKYIFK